MSSSAKTGNRGRVIARIHIAKHQLRMDEAEYRTMLAAQTGKDSCGKMSLGELFQVEEYLKRLGWKPTRPKSGGKRISPKSAHKELHKKDQVDKLRALWIDMHKDGLLKDGSENTLEKWVQRMSARYNKGQGIEKVDWLRREDYVCHQLIESLKQWRKRMIKEKQHANE